MEKNGGRALKGVSLAVFYGCGVGVALLSYAVRSGVFHFVHKLPFEGSTTVVDVLGYPTQMEIFWYMAFLVAPVAIGMVYGLIERFGFSPIERAWWISILVFILQSPLLALGYWPGIPTAAAHILILAFLPFAVTLLSRSGVEEESEAPPASGLADEPPSGRSEWPAMLLSAVFAGFIFHSFITMHKISYSRLVAGTVVWAVLTGAGYAVLFGVVKKLFAGSDKSRRTSPGWGMLPVVILPLYQLFWGHRMVLVLLFSIAVAAGIFLYLRPPRIDPSRAALVFLPLGIGMAIHLTPLYRFGDIDVVHEGQQLAFAQCVMRGMYPGMERAVKYGPLYELSEGWTIMLFGARVTVLRIYSLWAQALGYWFGCLLLFELVRRKWLVVYGWGAYLVLSIAAVYVPCRFNGLRAGLPMLALFFWSVRCKGGGTRWLIAAGFTGAIGALYSVEFGIAGIVALLFGAISVGFGKGFSGGIKAFLREAAGLAAGAAIVAVLFALIYASHGGILKLVSGMYEYAEGFSMGYGAFPVPGFPWLDNEVMYKLGIGFFVKRFRFYMVPLAGLAAASWLAGKFLTGRWRGEHSAVCALLFYSLAGFRSAMGRSDLMHLVQSTAPFAVLILVMADRLTGQLRAEMAAKTRTARYAMPAVAVSIILLLALPLTDFSFLNSTFTRFMQHHRLKNYPAIEKSYAARKFVPLQLPRGEGLWVSRGQNKTIVDTTDFITANTGRDERIHIAPLFGMFFFFADRLPLTRYCLTIDAVTPQSRAEILHTLEREKPDIMLVSMDSGMDFSYSAEHPEEVEYILKHYTPGEKIGYLTVYRRMGQPDNR